MAFVINVSNGTRHIGGKTLAPGEMGDVNMSSSELGKHLFVRCGDIEVSKPTVSGKRKAQEPESTEE